jgi:hypothetical protein
MNLSSNISKAHQVSSGPAHKIMQNPVWKLSNQLDAAHGISAAAEVVNIKDTGLAPTDCPSRILIVQSCACNASSVGRMVDEQTADAQVWGFAAILEPYILAGRVVRSE